MRNHIGGVRTKREWEHVPANTRTAPVFTGEWIENTTQRVSCGDDGTHVQCYYANCVYVGPNRGESARGKGEKEVALTGTTSARVQMEKHAEMWRC